MKSQKKPDYTSRVPKYRFAETLEEQEAQLTTNPLMKRLAESRKRYEGDPHRPVYHYVNPENTLNDPNGLCFWQGRWHLFYQAYPPEDPRQHWGHAVSDDLIHWRDLPYAIYPNPERCCFSGSALVEDDGENPRVIAMYHGTEVGNIVAVSSDPLLLNWEKLTGQPVIPIRSSNGSPLPYNVHDPCIWSKDGRYYSLSNGRKPWLEMDYLFKSDDLENWEYLHPFIENDRFTLEGDDGACPYFWPIGNGANERHILLFFSHLSGGQYLLGDYDKERDKFVTFSHGKFNFGASRPGGVHAPSAAPDGKGGVIVIFNINEGKPVEGWDQIMSLPRRLTLTDSSELRMEPAGNIESLRRDHQQIGAMTLPANREVVLESIHGNAMELELILDPKDSPMLEVNVLRSPAKEEFTRIAFYKKRGLKYRPYHPNIRALSEDSPELKAAPVRHESIISLDTSYTSMLPDVLSRSPEKAPIHLEDDEPLRLRIFIDRSVVEVFANGKQCLAVRVYPGREDSVGVSLRAQGQDAELVSLDAWQMKNIFT